MRILCISPVFVPMADSEAFCGAKMVQALLARDAGIKVLTLKDKSSLEMTRDGSAFWEPLYEGIIDEVQVPERGRYQSLLTTGRYRMMTWGGWIDAVVKRAIQFHSEKPYDIVYSRSLPMIAHVAGYWVSRTLNLPWVANMNDPWDWHLFPEKVSIKKSFLKRMYSNYWFRKTFRAADLLTFPNKRLYRYHLKMVPSRLPTAIIPHVGYGKGNGQEGGNGFCLVHAGKLGFNEAMGRPATSLLRGLRRFFLLHPEARSLTNLTLVGPRDAATESLIMTLALGPYVKNTGWVSYEESLRHIGAATVCVLIEGKMSEGIYLPSKAVDYITAKKPLLAMSPAAGVIADLPRSAWLLRVDVDDEIGVAQAIAAFYDHYRKNTMARCMPPEDLTDQYRPAAVAGKFLDSVSGVLRCSSS